MSNAEKFEELLRSDEALQERDHGETRETTVRAAVGPMPPISRQTTWWEET